MRVFTYTEKVQLFGDPKPRPLKDGYAKLDPDFLVNIKFFDFPILGRLYFHSKVFPQLFNCLKVIEKQGLAKEIDVETTKRIGGTFVPRYQRWDPKYSLSSHAFGIAIDMFSVGSNGEIKKVKWSEEFIKIFEDNGFYWGGNFKGFYDPVHFEVCRIINVQALIS
jgi:hypothetical protein